MPYLQLVCPPNVAGLAHVPCFRGLNPRCSRPERPPASSRAADPCNPLELGPWRRLSSSRLSEATAFFLRTIHRTAILHRCATASQALHRTDRHNHRRFRYLTPRVQITPNDLRGSPYERPVSSLGGDLAELMRDERLGGAWLGESVLLDTYS